MKIERRGKYPGVKVHLEKGECEMLIKLWESMKGINIAASTTDIAFLFKLARKVSNLAEEEPTLLEERSEEEILATLSKEAIESDLKLKAIGKGADWKKVKVEVVA